MDMKHEKLKNLPKADVVMEIPVLRDFLASTDRKTALEAVRKAVEEMRRALLEGGDPDVSAEAAASRACATASRMRFSPVTR